MTLTTSWRGHKYGNPVIVVVEIKCRELFYLIFSEHLLNPSEELLLACNLGNHI